MREIKFRAWHKNNKNICQNVTIDLLSRYYLEFMQYTGLKDKNGKEIYEGDILISRDKSIYKVIWKTFSWQYEYKFKRFYDGESYIDTSYLPLGCREVEVIGNVFENKELLEVK